MKTLLVVLASITLSSSFAQSFNQKGSGQGGTISVGMRSTLSSFNDSHGDTQTPHGNHEDDGFSTGLGGQFRVQASNRVNTEWFFDYLPGGNSMVRRIDYHVGWSVMFYVLEKPNPLFRPYVLGGHCFDYTYRRELADHSNQVNRWSGAVQMGVGTHIRLTDRLDFSIATQYMMHLGTHIETVYNHHDVEFAKTSGGSLEGHLLTTMSFNFKFADLW